MTDCGTEWWQEPCAEDDTPADDNEMGELEDFFPDGFGEEEEPMEGDDHDMGDMDYSMRDEKEIEWILNANPMAGNLVATLVSWSAFTRYLLEVVMYSDLLFWEFDNDLGYFKTYYDYTTETASTSSGSTDYLGMAVKLRAYSGVALWGVLAITQLLSSLGIMASINMMTWGYGMPVMGLICLVESILLLLGFNGADADFNDTDKAGDLQKHSKVAIAYRDQFYKWAGEDGMIGASLNAYINDWMVAQWLALAPEEAEAMREAMWTEWQEKYDALMESDAAAAGAMKEEGMDDSAAALMRHHLYGF